MVSFKIQKNHYKIVNRKRLTLSLIIMAFIFTVGIKVLAAPRYIPHEEYKIYIVTNGDSLWNIAKKYTSDNTDPRNFIQDVKVINNLNDSNIHVVQKLKIKVN